MVAKKRGIVKKPGEKAARAASEWVLAGGVDPELKQSDAQTSKHLPSESLAKSKDPDYARATIYLPKTLHKRLKLAATVSEIEMSDIAEQAITKWLDEHSNV